MKWDIDGTQQEAVLGEVRRVTCPGITEASLEFSEGDAVEAKCRGYSDFFPGVVDVVSAEAVAVKWDIDVTKHDVRLAEVRKKPRPALRTGDQVEGKYPGYNDILL